MIAGTLEGFEDGELLAQLKKAVARAGVQTGWVRAIGEVSDVIVAKGGRPIGNFERATLVSLDASVSDAGKTIRAMAVLAVNAGGVPLTVSGELLSATCEDVQVGIMAFGASAPTETASYVAAEPTAAAKPAAKPASQPRRPERPQRPQPKAPRKPSKPAAASPASAWSRVAEVSAAVEAGDDWENEVDVDQLNRGDKLHHPALDVCTVVNVISDDAIKVQLPNRAVRKLSMKPFVITKEGPGVFRLHKRS